MRIFRSFPDALGEIKRDLKEMGIRVHSQTYQDQYIGDNSDFETLELQNYSYTVVQPVLKELNPTLPWADAEFEERIGIGTVNPGEAWKLRPEVWTQFLHGGQFSYTYSERLNPQLYTLLENLTNFPDNRNHLLTVWESTDLDSVGISRVPCSISYHFLKRDNQLKMTYQQRSADIATHLENDIYLAYKLQCWVANRLEWPVGHYIHFIGSLHAYQKDLQNVF